MELFLVQHGGSFTEEQDPERGLTPEGTREVAVIAARGADLNVRPRRIFHSSKKRSRQTAVILEKVLKPKMGIRETSGINPKDDVETFAAEFSEFEGAMIVGHLPFLEKLASHLTGGNVNHPVFRFQNAGIVRLLLAADRGQWTITGTLLPDPLGKTK